MRPGPLQACMHACMRLRGKCAQASASECARLSAYRHVRRWATQWSSWMDLLRASGRPRGRLHWRRGIGSAPQHKNSTACWLQHITTDCNAVPTCCGTGRGAGRTGGVGSVHRPADPGSRQACHAASTAAACCNTVQHVAIQYSRVWHRAPLRHANFLDEGSGRRAQEEVSTGFQDGVHEGGSKGRSARGSTYQRNERQEMMSTEGERGKFALE